jgi:hypothetical protein
MFSPIKTQRIRNARLILHLPSYARAGINFSLHRKPEIFPMITTIINSTIVYVQLTRMMRPISHLFSFYASHIPFIQFLALNILHPFTAPSFFMLQRSQLTMCNCPRSWRSIKRIIIRIHSILYFDVPGTRSTTSLRKQKYISLEIQKFFKSCKVFEFILYSFFWT